MGDPSSRWTELMQRCGVAPARAAPCFQALERAYGEPHRAYHTLTHITHFLDELDGAGVTDPAAHWAAWYHDVVYQPGAADNEAVSAERASAVLAELGLESLAPSVAALILATAHHEAPPGDPQVALFLDADLAILGAAPAAYDAYAAAVRQEFRHLPGFLYRPGRSRFLASMLARPRIFQSGYFFDRYEAQARTNLERERSGPI